MNDIIVDRGIEHDDGWLPLIEELVVKLRDYNKTVDNPVQIVLAKEKFGILNIFLNYIPNDEIKLLCWELEQRSITLCEHCGMKVPRYNRDKITYKNLCKDCKERTY